MLFGRSFINTWSHDDDFRYGVKVLQVFEWNLGLFGSSNGRCCCCWPNNDDRLFNRVSGARNSDWLLPFGMAPGDEICMIIVPLLLLLLLLRGYSSITLNFKRRRFALILKYDMFLQLFGNSLFTCANVRSWGSRTLHLDTHGNRPFGETPNLLKDSSAPETDAVVHFAPGYNT